jgi:hypothetical protein
MGIWGRKAATSRRTPKLWFIWPSCEMRVYRFGQALGRHCQDTLSSRTSRSAHPMLYWLGCREPELRSGGLAPRCRCGVKPWRGVRVAEGARLESVFTSNRDVGSNPTLSAILN